MSSTAGLVTIESISRRAAVRRIALAVTASGLGKGLFAADAEHVHAEVSEERTLHGEYTVKYFNEHEFSTVGKLAELVLPADSRGPSGRDTGGPEFIDMICSHNRELADIVTGGILWLDDLCAERFGSSFAEAGSTQQTEILDAILAAEHSGSAGGTKWNTAEYPQFSVFGVRAPSAMQRGVRLFGWVRQLTVDAYCTSPAGIRDLGFQGNSAHTEYRVPQEAIDYAIARSPFADA